MGTAIITIKGSHNGTPPHTEFFENLYDSFAEFAIAAGEDFDVDLTVSYRVEGNEASVSEDH